MTRRGWGFNHRKQRRRSCTSATGTFLMWCNLTGMLMTAVWSSLKKGASSFHLHEMLLVCLLCFCYPSHTTPQQFCGWSSNMTNAASGMRRFNQIFAKWCILKWLGLLVNTADVNAFLMSRHFNLHELQVEFWTGAFSSQRQNKCRLKRLQKPEQTTNNDWSGSICGAKRIYDVSSSPERRGWCEGEKDGNSH